MLNKDRYRLYREHKYLFYVFSEILRLTALLDLSRAESRETLKNELGQLELLLQAHVEYEESRIHSILKDRHSPLFSEAEHQHRDQKLFFDRLKEKMAFLDGVEEKEAHFLGYELYLELRKFFGEYLNHFDYEERIIMPELQRLVSDEELREIDQVSYRQMSAEQLVEMMEVLFPHMNYEDRLTFLTEIKNCDPQKLAVAWKGITPFLEENERNKLAHLLNG